MGKLKIYFDGSCYVCSNEMVHYTKIVPKGTFDYVNIADENFDALKEGLDPMRVNSEMHVKLPSGEVRHGVDAFAAIWENIPRYKWAARLVSFPLCTPIAKALYFVFARGIRPWLPKRKSCPILN